MKLQDLKTMADEAATELARAETYKRAAAEAADLRKALGAPGADRSSLHTLSFMKGTWRVSFHHNTDAALKAELEKLLPDVLRCIEMRRQAEERAHRIKARLLQQQVDEFLSEPVAAE